jgi:hypothetical protein
LIVDAQRIVDTTKVPLNLHGEYSRGGTKPALVDIDQGIQLNGANRSHEAFIIKNEATNFNFCKTARKPYDRSSLQFCCELRIWPEIRSK